MISLFDKHLIPLNKNPYYQDKSQNIFIKLNFILLFEKIKFLINWDYFYI
jgi:hypothetical protein